MTDRRSARLSLLAQSLLPVSLLMLISGVLVLPLLLLRQTSPPFFWRWSLPWLVFLAGYVVVLLGLATICWWSHTQASDSLQQKLNRLLPSSFEHIFWIVVLLGSFLFLGIAVDLLFSSGSRAVQILAGLIVFWLGLIWMLAAGLYRPLLQDIFSRSQPLIVGLALTITMFLVVETALHLRDLIFGNPHRLEISAEEQRLARFLGQLDMPWLPAYLAEYRASETLQWTPYVYWRRAPFSGEFINIDARGLRQTVTPESPADLTIFVFGGSTVWGTGARDAHTIPSEIAAVLAEQGVQARVVNFGEIGYVSQQDLLLFQIQLQRGNRPDVAVFYWGFNDIFSAWSQDQVGIPFNEANRVVDFGSSSRLDVPLFLAAASLLRETALGSRLTSLGFMPSSRQDLLRANLSLTGYPQPGSAGVASHLVQMMEQTSHLAKAYGVKVVFVLQPTLFLKETRCDRFERFDFDQSERFGVVPFYLEADALIQETARTTFGEAFVPLSDLFAAQSACVFTDAVHITEAGNRTVAEQIVQHTALIPTEASLPTTNK